MANKPTLVFFLCVLLIVANTFSLKAKASIAKPANWVVYTNYTHDEKLLANASDGYGYLLLDYQQNIEEKTIYKRFVTKIINTQGIQNGSQITVEYNPAYEKIVFHEIVIIRDGKIINCLDLNKIKSVQQEKDLERHLYDARETYFLPLEGVHQGDIIDYSYSKIGQNPLFKNNFVDEYYFEFGVPINYLNIKFLCHSSRKLNFKYFTKTIAPTIVKKGNLICYNWVQKSVASKNNDNDLPNWYENYNGVQVSDFQSWKEVRIWEEEVFKKAIDTPFNDAKFIENINQQCKTTSEKILKALHFVQNDIRYFGFENGIHSLTPHSPSDIYKQRFGDCKDKTVLLCSILKALHIEAFPVLVNNSTGFRLNKYLPSPYLFNHVIVAYKLNNILAFVDPTMSLQGGDLEEVYLPNYYYGLLLDNKSNQLEQINFRNLGSTKVDYNMYFTDLNAPVIFNVKTVYTGSSADITRYEMNVTSYSDLEKNYLNFYARYHQNIIVMDSIIFKELNNNQIEVIESYSIKDFWSKSETDSNKLHAEFIPYLISNTLSLPSTKVRKTPLYLKYPINITEIFYLHFEHNDWEIDIEDDNIKTNYIEYSASYRVSENNKKISTFYTLNTLQDSVGASNTAEAIKHFEKIRKNALVLTTSLNFVSDSNTKTSYSKIFLLVLILIILVTWALKIFVQFNPLSKSDGLTINPTLGGWLLLFIASLFLKPLFVIANLLNSGYFNTQMESLIKNTRNPAITSIIVDLELFFNTTILITSILCIFLAYYKRTSFPIIATFLLIFTAVGGFLDAWVVNVFIDSNTAIIDKQLLYTFGNSLVWIPYIMLSQRSKSTFINHHPSKNKPTNNNYEINI